MYAIVQYYTYYIKLNVCFVGKDINKCKYNKDQSDMNIQDDMIEYVQVLDLDVVGNVSYTSHYDANNEGKKYTL